LKILGTVSKETLAELMQATLDNDVESLKEINKKIKEEMSESS
jgi:hypothetical protein